MLGLFLLPLLPVTRRTRAAFSFLPGKWLVGCLLLGATSGCATTGSNLALPKAGGPVSVSMKREPTTAERAFWDQIGPAQVLYVPERHDDNNDHAYQLEVMKGLRSRNVDFAIGWEMFDVTQQGLLDQWNDHRISTETLLDKTDWQKSWGGMSVMYEKLLRWSLGEGVKSVGLNAPQSLSHKTRTGEELTPEERALLPGGFRPLPGGYEHFAEQMGASKHQNINPESIRSYYKAQLIWEQTMAARVLEWTQAHPDTKLVVFVGRGHVDGGFGVPAFVHQKSTVAQLVLYPGGAPAQKRPPLGDGSGTIAYRSIGGDGRRAAITVGRLAFVANQDAFCRTN